MKYGKHPPIPTECPYCKGEVVLTENDALYGRKIYKNNNCNIYLCFACMASIGTHMDGITPLGTMADKELKTLRKQAHDLFDPFWNSKAQRDALYKWLAKRLGIKPEDCHFGHFDKECVRRAIAILETTRKKKVK